MILRAISFLLLLLSPFLAMAAGGTVEVPEAFAWVIVIGAVIASIASIGGWVSGVRDRGERRGRTSERLGNVEKSVDNLGTKVNALGDKLEYESKEIRGLKERTNALDKKVETLTKTIISGGVPALSSNSPLSINKDGQEIAQKIDADKIFNNHWQYLKDFVEATGATLPYDVQSASISAALRMDEVLSDEEKRVIKESAYEKGMLYKTALTIFAVMARNRILKERESSEK